MRDKHNIQVHFAHSLLFFSAEGPVPKSVQAWLESLRLSEYLDTFHVNNFTSMDRVRNIWELELNSVSFKIFHYVQSVFGLRYVVTRWHGSIVWNVLKIFARQVSRQVAVVLCIAA